jgi:SAM-dependent methyltransferase
MKLEDGTEISSEQIEILNANGPYSMAIWRSGEVCVGNEEGLAGRSEYFIKLIRKSILKNYNLDEIKNLSILDIGCNDGWVLHQLSDLPFKKMVGVEPREKNINKGRIVRKILKLENSIDYRIGDIESLKDEVFDIVICAGLLYHVESIPLALKKVRESCRHMLFIESRCISSSHITQKLKDEIEMRDLVYQFEDEICGVTAQKYESSYYDGSASHNTIVNIPTTSSLIMNLKILGFDEIDIVADEDTYRRDVWQDKRPLGGVCITATISGKLKNQKSEEMRWIKDYEIGLENEILPRNFLEPLYRMFCLRDESIELSSNLLKVKKYLTSNIDISSINTDFFPKSSNLKFALEIVKNWRYCPHDKIALEYGKLLNHEGKLEEAINVLKEITTNKINSDWRAVYRSFHLLSQIYSKLKNEKQANKYKELCIKSNNKYPLKIKT